MAYSLSDKLKFLRLNNNLTQTDIGKHLNMTRQGYAHYEKGDRDPDPKTILKLARFYDVDVVDLIDDNVLPSEIAYFVESTPYSTDRTYKDLPKTKRISISVTSQEMNLIRYFRKLDPDEKVALLNIIEEKTKNKE